MTEAMPFLQKAILLSYDPRPFAWGAFVDMGVWKRKINLNGRRWEAPALAKTVT